MNRKTRMAALAAALFVLPGVCAAGQLEWKQTINLPKGLNVPQGVKADILGIELGDTYAEAKAKLEKIQAEAKVPGDYKRMTVINRIIRLPTHGGAIKVSYVGGLRLDIRRVYPPASPLGNEHIEVLFSAPSSGQQVLGVHRLITYNRQSDQIRVSELVSNLKAKYKAEPQVIVYGSERNFIFQYNSGRAFRSPGKYQTCKAWAFTHQDTMDQHYLREINPDGKCDVALVVSASGGISRDHTDRVEFSLSDNERTKKNVSADFAFFNGYVMNLRQRSGGAAPKL